MRTALIMVYFVSRVRSAELEGKVKGCSRSLAREDVGLRTDWKH
jgi:hypothetical protein